MSVEAPIVTKNSTAALSLIEQNKTKIGEILPKGTAVGRYLGVMQVEINRNPDLATCHPATLVGSMIHCARLGLEPGLLNKIHLVPFYNKRKQVKECTVIVGYEGLIDLAMKSGLLSNIQSHLVYERDEFSAELGSSSMLVHRPLFFGDRGKIIGAYAIAFFKDGQTKFEVMTKEDIDAIAAKSKSEYIWKDYWGEMARKTVLRRLCKHLEKSASPELSHAIALENKSESEDGQGTDAILLDAGISYEAPPTKAESDEFEVLKGRAIEMLQALSDEDIQRIFKLPLATIINKIDSSEKAQKCMMIIKAGMK